MLRISQSPKLRTLCRYSAVLSGTLEEINSTIQHTTHHHPQHGPGRECEEVEHPGPGAEDGDQPEHQVAAGDDQQQEQPEPEQDVDLVIHHVDRQDAETVESRKKFSLAFY